jgi:hypothetical protein
MRIRIDYRDSPWISPLTPWVHKGVDALYWKATLFDPPMPRATPGKGWPVWVVEYRGRELVFASPEEIEHAIDILSRKVLPAARKLGRPYRAVNSHWLSRLLSSFKPWKVRLLVVKRLRQAPPA